MQEHKNNAVTFSLQSFEVKQKKIIIKPAKNWKEKWVSTKLNYHYSKQKRRKEITVMLLDNLEKINFQRKELSNIINFRKRMVIILQESKAWYGSMIYSADFFVVCQLSIGQMEILDWTEVGEWGWESKIWKSSLFPSHKHDI